MTPTRVKIRIILLALGLQLEASIFAHAQQDPDIVDDVPRQANVANEVNFGANDATFDQWVFGNAMQSPNASAARIRINSALDLQIAALSGVTSMSEEQKKKLRLAGRGDIKRFFDQVEEKRTRFNLIKNDRNKFGEFYQEIVPLQATLNMGLFREGSLFFKTLQSSLDADQATRFARLQEERRRFRWRAKVELVSDIWANTLGLNDDHRRRLVDTILAEVPTPKALGQLDYYFVMYKLSRMPGETLRSIFDDAQWKQFDRQVNQARGFQMFLKQQGYDQEDLADPAPRLHPKEAKSS